MWGQGYVTDVEYTSSFFSVLAPSHLRFVLALKGIQPSSAGTEFDYMELGFGQGSTLAVLAAANPRARFWGNDFNPTHVQRARARADQAGLTNVTYLERSFADVGEAGLPPMDFIVLHGIYSWISEANQRAIVDFIDGHLKPGGVVYVSYNTAPGWSPAAPMQWLARTFADRIPGRSDARLKGTVDFLKKLKDADAGYFKANPRVGSIVDRIAAGSKNYAIHEYLNENWHLLSHLELANHFERAKLSFAASADVIEILEHFTLSKPARELLHELADDPLRETVKDFLTNNNFRRDIFVRGGMTVPERQRLSAIAAIPVALVKPRADCDLAVKFPVGTVSLAADRHLPILDALARRPHTVGELAGGSSPEQIAGTARSVVALASARYVGPCVPGWIGTPDPDALAATRRLNRVLMEETRGGATHRVLASPVLGSGIIVDPAVQRRILAGEPAPEAPEAREKLAKLVDGHRPLFDALALSASLS